MKGTKKTKRQNKIDKSLVRLTDKTKKIMSKINNIKIRNEIL